MSVFVLGVYGLCNTETVPFTSENHQYMTSTTTTMQHQSHHLISSLANSPKFTFSDPDYNNDYDPEKCERDRFFDPWRVPTTKAAANLIEDIIKQIDSYEVQYGMRGRARQKRHSENHELAVSAIACDMLHYIFSGETNGAAISRSKRLNTVKSRYKPEFIGKTLPDILDTMAAGPLSIIRQEIGYEDWSASRHQITKIYPGEGLFVLMDKHNIKPKDIRCRPQRECIVLKSTKNGYWDNSVPIEYPDTDRTHAYRAELQIINEWIAGGRIEYHPAQKENETQVDLSDRYLRRIFTRNRFDSGGRLFGGFWQNLKRRYRKGIMIEGEPAWEMDYRQIAPRILYSIAGAKPKQSDIYAIPQFAGHPSEKNYREGFKKLLNTLLFIEKPISRKPKGTARTLPPGQCVTELADMLRDNHPDISPYFESGIGHHLQFLESEILIDVMIKLMEKGIVALPLHDAVMVPKSRIPEANTIMRNTFFHHTGLNIDLSIKEAGTE
ncbi:hypothetical protein [Methylorubrum sp. POS3]|uniref:hypothetical protein n=1 Tax=Methylorubrum sp. POS3 TaxID=2998492 RepID=UPI003727E533